MAKKKGQIPAGVIALRKILINDIKTRGTAGKSMDQLCFEFNMMKAAYGSNVVTIADYAAAAGINYSTFVYTLTMYRKCQQAAIGALAGEK